jgi:hypothetical protein
MDHDHEIPIFSVDQSLGNLLQRVLGPDRLQFVPGLEIGHVEIVDVVGRRAFDEIGRDRCVFRFVSTKKIHGKIPLKAEISSD